MSVRVMLDEICMYYMAFSLVNDDSSTISTPNSIVNVMIFPSLLYY